MGIQLINIGTTPNDGAGDPLRTAFVKVNNNFTELYSAAVLTSNAITTANTGNVVVWQSNASTFTQGTFQINSQQVNGNNSQNVTLVVACGANSTTVNHTAYSTLIVGNAIINGYSVAVANVVVGNTVVANVQITVSIDGANLGANANIIHTVAYRAS